MVKKLKGLSLLNQDIGMLANIHTDTKENDVDSNIHESKSKELVVSLNTKVDDEGNKAELLKGRMK